MFGAWWLVLGMVGAQESTQVPLEVVTLDGATECGEVVETHIPGMVRTSAGLAVHQGDGTYRFACASAFGGEPDGSVASSSDGSVIYMVANGRLFNSQDGGCTSFEVPLTEGQEALQVLFWRQSFWLLTTGVAGGGELLRFDEDGPLSLAAWETFTPDGMAPEGANFIWVAGARPQPDVRRLSVTGGLGGDETIEDLPDISTDVEEVLPMVAHDGEAWLKLRRENAQWMWHAWVEGDDVLMSESPDQHRSILGPVMDEGAWYAIFDQKLHVAVREIGTWSDTGQTAPWTCLHAVGSRLFGCTVQAILAVEDIDAPEGPLTSEVFRLVQVGDPTLACGTISYCETDWVTWGGAAGLLDAPRPAVCPDGRTTPTGAPGGCGCASNFPSVGWIPIWLGLWGVRRRARLG